MARRHNYNMANLSPELLQLRDEFYDKARSCGWIRTGKTGEVSRTVSTFFSSNKHKPINELREILFSSKYVKEENKKLIQLRDEFYDKASSCGWIRTGRTGEISQAASSFFARYRNKPINELREILFSSKYVEEYKGSNLSKELIALRDEFYDKAKSCGWIKKDTKASVAHAVTNFFNKHKQRPLNELRETLFSSKYAEEHQETNVSKELEQLRDEFYDQAKTCGWITKGTKAGISPAASMFFRYHKQKPINELREILFSSKYVEEYQGSSRSKLSKKLIALRDKFYHQAKACGWIEPGTKRSISDTVRKFFASYKHKPINELREILFSSKYVKTNPAKYQNLDYLQEYINPYLTQIKEVMVNYCNFMRGTREHPESVETLSKNLAKELLEFIPDANAVHALVTNYFNYTLQAS